MAQVTPQLIKELRDRTQAGMADCKNALVEADGDMEKAVEVILKKGIVKAASRAGKVAAEGEVCTLVADGGKRGVLVEVNCQTDFVARGEAFKGFVANVAKAALALDKGKDLSAAPYANGDKSIDLVRQELVGKIGENMVVRRWDVLEATEEAGFVHAYVHMGGKLAVLVHAEAPSAELAKSDDVKTFIDNVAMQIAAMNPLVVRKDELAQADIDKQRDIYLGQMKEEQDGIKAQLAELEGLDEAGRKEAADSEAQFEAAVKKLKSGLKPENMWEKIVDGKVTKWFAEVTLLGQDNVWEPGAGSIDKIRQELGKKVGGEVKIHSFLRFGLGDGIEKKQEDLAAEVAKTIGA